MTSTSRFTAIMWNEFQAHAKNGMNFNLDRWGNPLHAQEPTELVARLWPSGEEFYHPINPMFSFFIKTQTQLDYYNTILLRDGAQGILDFFLRFPVPKIKTTRLLVPADLLFLVPEKWRSHVLAYRMERNGGPLKKAKKKWLFYGLINESLLSWESFQKDFSQWLMQFPKDADVCAYMMVRTELFDHVWLDRTLMQEVLADFLRHFKTPVKFLQWDDFKSSLNLGDATLVNMDLWRQGANLCSVESFAMAKSPALHPRGEYQGFKGEKIGEWALSFQHKLVIYTAEAEHMDYNPFLFFKKLSPQAENTFPMPIKIELRELLRKRLHVSGVSAT